MPQIVLLVGVLITGVASYLFLQPTALRGLLDKAFASRWLYALALLRLTLGALLLASADTVAYSGAVEVFGWLFAFSGLSLVVVPAPALQRMAAWFGRLSSGAARLWLSLAILFGLFFVYAAMA